MAAPMEMVANEVSFRSLLRVASREVSSTHSVQHVSHQTHAPSSEQELKKHAAKTLSKKAVERKAVTWPSRMAKYPEVDTGVLQEKAVHPKLMLVTIFQMIASTTKTSWMRLQNHTISIQFSGRLVQILHCSERMVDLVVVELAHWDGVLWYFHPIRCWFVIPGFQEFSFLLRSACVAI